LCVDAGESVHSSSFIIAQSSSTFPDNFNAESGEIAVESPFGSSIFFWESSYES
jgi:hypothetical protein